MSDGPAGLRVLVTQAGHQNSKLIAQLKAVGAVPVVFPTIEIGPADDPAPLIAAINDLAGYDWLVFTSANGVTQFWEQATAMGKTTADYQAIAIAAVGPATAAALSRLGLSVELMPAEQTATALLAAFGPLQGRRVLWPTADIARPTLSDGLRAKGATVNRVTAYQTHPVTDPGSLLSLLPSLDILTFTSSSTVLNFVNLLPPNYLAQTLGSTRVICIGPVTAQTAADLGLPVHAVPETHTIAGLVESLVRLTSLQPV